MHIDIQAFPHWLVSVKQRRAQLPLTALAIGSMEITKPASRTDCI